MKQLNKGTLMASTLSWSMGIGKSTLHKYLINPLKKKIFISLVAGTG
jgi:hypothetical protein